MWIINRRRNRVYGEVVRVLKDGGVVWKGPFCNVTTAGALLYDQGCEYVEEVPEGFERVT
jgi:hypothetical protein